LESAFFGKVKIEILSLDGRVLQVFEIENSVKGSSVFVRILDGNGSAVRLALKS
jgi:hypothetical protein